MLQNSNVNEHKYELINIKSSNKYDEEISNNEFDSEVLNSIHTSALIVDINHNDNEDFDLKDIPFPWKPMLALDVGMVAHSICFTSPLPFVAYMVVDFGMADDLDKAGYAAGWITGSFMIGRFISGIGWGVFADRYGRRLSLLLSLFNIGFFMLLFGFSTSFEMAVVSRFCLGLGNGYMGICKTSLSEVCSTKLHEMKGFGLLNAMWAMGMIVGPSIGGLLSRPAILYPNVFDTNGVFGIFPYLLPSLMCCLIAVFAFVLIYMYVPETGGKIFEINSKNKRNNKKLNISNKIDKFENSKLDSIKINNNDDNTSSNSSPRGEDRVRSRSNSNSLVRMRSNSNSNNIPNLNGSTLPNILTSQQRQILSNKLINGPDYELLSKINIDDIEKQSLIVDVNTNDKLLKNNDVEIDNIDDERETFISMLKNKEIRYFLIIYMLYCFVTVVVDEVYPLWTLASESKGGLEESSFEVGEILASVGLGILLFQLFLYEPILKAFCVTNSRNTIFRFASFSACFIVLIPISVIIVQAILSKSSTYYHPVKNYALVFIISVYKSSGTSVYSTLGVCINSAVKRTSRATMNGLIMTFGSIGNALGPISGSILYAFLLEDKNNWIDGRFIFLFAGIGVFSIALVIKKYGLGQGDFELNSVSGNTEMS